MAIESKMRRGPVFSSADGAGTSRRWVVALVVVLVVAALAGAWAWSRRAPFAEGTYQAVFLDNGQAYFGMMERGHARGFVRLTDVYYLDYRQDPQDAALQAADLQLLKLGGEVHGPEDAMEINRDHVLYVETLRGDSKIVQAIAEYAAASNP